MGGIANNMAGTMLDYQGEGVPSPSPAQTSIPSTSQDSGPQITSQSGQTPKTGFWSRLADHLVNGGGIGRQKNEENLRQEQVNTHILQQKARQADLEMAQSLQHIARPVHNGVVFDSKGGIPDPLTGEATPIYRLADKSRIFKQKTADGDDDVEHELLTPEEQIRHNAELERQQAEAGAPTADIQNQRAQATAEATAAGKAKGSLIEDPEIPLTPQDRVRMGLPEGQTTIRRSQAVLNAKGYESAGVNNQGKNDRLDKSLMSREQLAQFNAKAKSDLQSNQQQFRDFEAKRQLETNQNLSLQRSAVGAGLDPNLKGIALKNYDAGQATWQALQGKRQQLNGQAQALESLAHPDGGLQDGQTFVDPTTGRQQVMNQFQRSRLAAQYQGVQGQLDQIGQQQTDLEKTLHVDMQGAQQQSRVVPQGTPAAQGQLRQNVQRPGQGTPVPSGQSRPLPFPGSLPNGGAAITPRQKAAQADPLASAISNYDSPFPAARGTSQRAIRTANDLMGRVNEIRRANGEPDYDANEYAAKQATVKDFASGASSKQADALNTMVRHTDDLLNLIPKLGNGDFTPGNAVAQKIAEVFGAATPKNFDQLRDMVSGETVKLIRGGGGSVADEEAARKNILRSDSPSQLAGAVKTNFDVASGKMQTLNQRGKKGHLRGQNGEDFSVLDPGAAEILQRRGYDPKTLKTAPLPNGRGAVLDRSTAERFYQAAGGNADEARKLAIQNNWKTQ